MFRMIFFSTVFFSICLWASDATVPSDSLASDPLPLPPPSDCAPLLIIEPTEDQSMAQIFFEKLDPVDLLRRLPKTITKQIIPGHRKKEVRFIGPTEDLFYFIYDAYIENDTSRLVWTVPEWNKLKWQGFTLPMERWFGFQGKRVLFYALVTVEGEEKPKTFEFRNLIELFKKAQEKTTIQINVLFRK